jgi:hypothetical protein
MFLNELHEEAQLRRGHRDPGLRSGTLGAGGTPRHSRGD